MRLKRLFSLFILVFGLFAVVNSSFAQEAENHENATTEGAEAAHEEKKGVNITELVFGHVSDSHEWHLFSTKTADGHEKPFAFPLPMIIYVPNEGVKFMSSGHFEEWEEENGTYISN